MLGVILAIAGLLLAGGGVQAQVRPAPGAADTEPLTLEQVYTLLRAGDARLAAAGARVEALGALEPGAGTLPDPALQLGFMNLSLPSLDADMPTSMAPSIQLMQMLPLPGKLGLSSRIAATATAQARSAADETWWETRAEAAMAFGMVVSADAQIRIMEETQQWLEGLQQIARAMYASGEGRQSDALRAGLELSRMEAELVRMRAMRAAAAARLNARLGLPAEQQLRLAAPADEPAPLPDHETLRAWAAETRPMLEQGRLEVLEAQQRLALARRELWPDPVIGIEYGQRRDPVMGGTERMASVMVGVSVPLFAGRRQLRMRDEASAMERMAAADLRVMQADVDARLLELRAELERTRTLVALYRTDVLPRAAANEESAFSAYRVGRVDFMTLLEARMLKNQYQQELAALRADWLGGVAELEMTMGRALPAAPGHRETT